VTEDSRLPFTNNWRGTGLIEGSGDAETLALMAGEYMESTAVATWNMNVLLLQNVYGAGDDAILKYRTGITEYECLNAAWTLYAGSFKSLGFVQVRVEVAE
jgi:hypothetical protein